MKTTRTQRWVLRAVAGVAILGALVWLNYSRLVNLAIPGIHRPASITYPIQHLITRSGSAGHTSAAESSPAWRTRHSC